MGSSAWQAGCEEWSRSVVPLGFNPVMAPLGFNPITARLRPWNKPTPYGPKGKAGTAHHNSTSLVTQLLVHAGLPQHGAEVKAEPLDSSRALVRLLPSGDVLSAREKTPGADNLPLRTDS